MRVVIAEQIHEGHYYNYVRLLLNAIRPLTNDVVLVLTPEGAASPEFKAQLASASAGLDVLPILRKPRPGMVKSSIDKVRNLYRAIRATRPDAVCVATGDHVAEASGLVQMSGFRVVPRHVHCECLMTRLTFAYPGSHRTVPAPVVLTGLRHSPFDPIHIIDVFAYDWIQRLGGPALAKKFQMHPDPVEPIPAILKADAREKLRLPLEGRYICCPGVLLARKGLDLLVDAFAHSDVRPDDRLLLVGKPDDEIRAFLRRDPNRRLIDEGRIQLIDRYVTGEEFNCAFRAADVIACPYPLQPHPSSIAVKAMAAERPVLGADNYWIGHMVPLFEMGWSVNVKDRAAFARALRQSLEEAPTWRRSEAARRLVEFNSIEAFEAMWTAALRSKMGLPPPPPQRAWPWVVEALTSAAHRQKLAGVGS